MTTAALPARQSSALLSVVLDRGDDATLTRQLYVQLREIILGGRLSDGARMPSTRRLCLELQVSRTVTLAAYDQLAAEGYLGSRPGSGFFVEPLVHRNARREGADPGHHAENASHEPEFSDRPFNARAQAVTLFPHRTWARLLARSWRQQGDGASHLTARGFPRLREAVAQHLYALRGVPYHPDQILITTGNSDALQLIVRSFARPRRDGRDSAWVEDPSYEASVRVLRAEGLTIVPVPVDASGLNVAAGIALDGTARFALLTPARQFPLGMPLALNRRLELLNWARDSGAILIEDDYDSEIRFTGRAVPSLAALGPELVLTLGSLSKLTFPGLRIGYIAGPPRMISRLASSRSEAGAHVATTGQAALAEFLQRGAFAKHLRACGALEPARKLLLQRLEADVGTDVVVLPQEVGMHLTILLGERFQAASAESGWPGRRRPGASSRPTVAAFDPGDGPQRLPARLAGWSEADLITGVQRLGQVLQSVPVPAERPCPRPGERINPSARAGVAQWQSRSFPSLRRGFDSLHPLHA